MSEEEACPDCEGEMEVEYTGRWSGYVCQACGYVRDEDSALEYEAPLADVEGEVDELCTCECDPPDYC